MREFIELKSFAGFDLNKLNEPNELNKLIKRSGQSGKNLKCDCQVLPTLSLRGFPSVIARHEVPKQSQIGQKEKKHSVIGNEQSAVSHQQSGGEDVGF